MHPPFHYTLFINGKLYTLIDFYQGFYGNIGPFGVFNMVFEASKKAYEVHRMAYATSSLMF
jgi:hypothetical protein